MGYAVPPPVPPPRTNAADIAVSIVLIVVTVLSLGFGALMGLSSLAFLDHCPPSTCSPAAAVTASMTTVTIAVLLGLAGIVTTIVRLAIRKPAWPFAVGTLGACVGVFILGAAAYTAAVS